MTGQSIKKDSYQWYKTVREGQYEYIHEFKERIDEIISMQKKHHEIIEENKQSDIDYPQDDSELEPTVYICQDCNKAVDEYNRNIHVCNIYQRI
jgi:hypothetical protein